jgi:MFS family permease
VAAQARTSDRSEPRAAGVLGAALAAALLFSLPYLAPLVAVFAFPIAPFPLVAQRVSRGLASSIMATLLAACLLSWLISPSAAFGFLAVLVLPGLLIAEGLARGRGLRRGAAWAFFLLAFEIAAMLLVAGPQVAAGILDPLNELRSPQFLSEMRAQLPQESVDAWAEQATTLYNVMEVVYPAALLIMGALVVLVNAALLRLYLARRDPGWLEGGEFEGLRFPLLLPVLFVMGGLFVIVPSLRPAGYNLVLLAGFFFAVQGLAVVAYYARRLAGPTFLRAGLLLLVLLNPWAPQILALLGLFDTWADFRRWADPPKPEQG